ncbi:MAG: hypothetical protein ACTHYR_04185 [Brachybacterium sp.]
MARKSTRASEARARARERAIRFQEREQHLVKIAEQFEEAQLELEAIDAATDERIAKIREQAEARVIDAREQAQRDAADAHQRAEQLQRDMLEKGISRREVAERLGITTREVVRQAKEAVKVKMTESELKAAASELAAKGEIIHLDGNVHRQLSVGSADGTEVDGILYVDGEEQGPLSVDLATTEWGQ